MYDSVAEFLKSMNEGRPLLWALLVTGVVAAAGLALFGFWETVFRLLSTARAARKDGSRSSK